MIALRRMQAEDRDQVRAWRNLPSVARFMYSDRTIPAAEHAAWFQRVLDDPACTYWIITCDGADVGGTTGERKLPLGQVLWGEHHRHA